MSLLLCLIDNLAIFDIIIRMKREFNFSPISYEHVHHESSLPFKAFFISVGFRGFHWHKDFEIILVLKGEVNLMTHEGNKELSEGDLFLTNSNDVHGLFQGKKDNLLLVLQIDPDISSEYHQNLQNVRFRLPSNFNQECPEYKNICRSLAIIMIEVLEKNAGFDYFCMSEVYKIIGLISRNYSIENDKKFEENIISSKINRLKKMLEFINENHQEDITLQELADTLELSTFYVSHLIKKFTGYSFQENLGLIRTQHAIKLMMNSSNRLIDIAMEVGFSDIRYFNKYFKKIFSMTPRELRKIANWQKIISNDYNKAGEDINQLLTLVKTYL